MLIKNEHDFIQSLNLAFFRSSGEYIARMDSDDIMLPHRLQKQYEYMEENPGIDVCSSWTECFGIRSYTATYPTTHEDIVKSMLLRNTICHPTVLLRRASLIGKIDLESVYKDKYIYAEDYKLWTELIMKGLKFYTLPEVLIKYRLSDTQVTSVKREHMWRSTALVQFDYVYYIANKVVERNPDYFEVIERMIDLFNGGKMNFRTFQHTIHICV